MNRQELVNREHCLTVVRPAARPVPAVPGQPGNPSTYVPDVAEVFIAILDDDRILAFNGHVDLGTGIRTALAQIVAEELDVVPLACRNVLGSH